jgi:hypothetical protein
MQSRVDTDFMTNIASIESILKLQRSQAFILLLNRDKSATLALALLLNRGYVGEGTACDRISITSMRIQNRIAIVSIRTRDRIATPFL